MSRRICEGLTALVTGASQGGTGTAVAVRLAAEGAKVAITARNEPGLQETRTRIEAIGGECVVLPADLSDPAGGRRELVSQTESAFGPIDILVNDAAVAGAQPFDEVTVEDLEQAFQVNFWAPWELTKAVIPQMRARGRGWILNLTTLAAELLPGPPFPTIVNAATGMKYAASKAALNRLTVSVACECEGQGIAVNALSPVATIATPRIVGHGGVDEAWSLFEPLEVMAEAALALCSCDPAIVTGRIAYSLQFLLEMKRPVLDLQGEHLVDGWQPADLRPVIDKQEAIIEKNGWPTAYSFHRVNSPRP
jgi:citronellol/citronellal dehydrogenase